MEKYDWSGDNIPEIDVHSAKKHEVLKEYLRKYILIVGGHPIQRRSLKLTLVDAFCGGGLYSVPGGGVHYGSPLVFLSSTEEAAAELRASKPEFHFSLNFIFIDSNRACVNFLKQLLIEKGYESELGKSIFLNCASFESTYKNIVEQILRRKGRAKRCIFLLDQYGYKDVPFCILKHIFLKLPKAEIILTVAVDCLINYLSDNDIQQKRLNDLGFTLDLSRLNEEKQQKAWRAKIQRSLYNDVVVNSGAHYFTNFFIKSKESHRSYWLMHMSMHPTARNAMQQLHWDLKNHFSHEGKPGMRMLGYDPTPDGFFQKQSFLFSNNDQEENHKALMCEIPDIIPKDGITFFELCNQHCNSTPSTTEMIQTATKELYANREIELFTYKRKAKMVGSSISRDDILFRRRQKFLFF